MPKKTKEYTPPKDPKPIAETAQDFDWKRALDLEYLTERTVCGCSWCKKSRAIKRAIKRRNPDELIKLLEDQLNENVLISEDLSWYKAIIDGSWFSAAESLRHALSRAEKMAEKQAKEDAKP